MTSDGASAIEGFLPISLKTVLALVLKLPPCRTRFDTIIRNTKPYSAFRRYLQAGFSIYHYIDSYRKTAMPITFYFPFGSDEKNTEE